MRLKIRKVKIGNKEGNPFISPSGVRMTTVPTMEDCLRITEIGGAIFKTVTREPRTINPKLMPNPDYAHREPIVLQHDFGIPAGFLNAVGLANPGVYEVAKPLEELRSRTSKIVGASISGRTIEEFVDCAKALDGKVDVIEENVSCPNVKNEGMLWGMSSQSVGDLTRAICSEIKTPVIVKVTPEAQDIGKIARAAIDAGACGITAINTVVGTYLVDGFPVLTNVTGGMSGRGIFPKALKCGIEIRQAIGKDKILILNGGISSARQVRECLSFADAVGIGSATAGMNRLELKRYYSTLNEDLENGTDRAEKQLKKIDMQYHQVTIKRKKNLACNFAVVETDASMPCSPGRFVFARIPGVGEKPFSVVNNNPLTLAVQTRGPFTERFNALKEGDKFYYKGPFGRGVDVPYKGDIVLVGGGCGIAGLTMLADRDYGIKGRTLTSLLGAKDLAHIPMIETFRRNGRTLVATENGEYGTKGFVTSLFSQAGIPRGAYFYNCGPAVMVDAVLPLELALTAPENIHTSLDYLTMCGVGLCGRCADKDGWLTCVEGPFMQHKP